MTSLVSSRARRRALLGLAGVAAAIAAPVARAQSPSPFPSRPVRVVVSFAAGGGLDLMARLVARKLSEQTGQQFVVENRPGAGGSLGAAAVAAAPADGYTILAGGNPEITGMPHLVGKLPYDPLRDLAPLVLAAYVPAVLVVNPSAQPAAGVRELIEAARRQPVPVATPGKGTPMHIALEVLNAQAGTQFVNTPYKGGGPAAQDVAAGQVGAAIVNLPPLRPHLAGGRIRALAVMQAARSPLLPNVPTLKEASGIDNVSAPSWFAFLAPADVPRPVLARLESEIRAALADPAIAPQLAAAGMDVVGLPAESFDRVLRAESAANAAAIRRFQISSD
ncbi:MAG: tripartite tricarboxylate transporter substrate binding protein [Burkholderiaceae bacterium]